MTLSKRLINFSVIVLAFFVSSGCVVGFANSQKQVTAVYSKIYMPAANDSSIFSGNSSRLSHAIRNQLALRSDVKLTPLENARVALIVKIIDRVQNISTIDECVNGGTVASGAYQCTIIHPELTGQPSTEPTSFDQPAISPSNENLRLVVSVKAVDLNTGSVLWKKNYLANNISHINFNEIGDPGDNRTINSMANTPDMHALRYQEAIDTAVESFSENIATSIVNDFLPALPKN